MGFLSSITKGISSVFNSAKEIASPITDMLGDGGWGSVISAGSSLLGGQNANVSNAKQASNQMDFQERMSNTAHQREVRDLAAAGLNPILSGTGGVGATTPSGASATIQDAVTPSITTGLAAKKLSQDLKTAKLNNDNQELTSKLIDAQTGVANTTNWNLAAQTEKTKQDTLTSAQNARESAARTAQALASTAGIQYDNAGKAAEAYIDNTDYGQSLRRANRAVPILNAGSNYLPSKFIGQLFNSAKSAKGITK